MKHYRYTTSGTCSRQIDFDLDGDVVHNINFTGGCSGNLKAIPIILEGWTVEEINDKLRGVMCEGKATSCSDQLSIAVGKTLEMQQSQDNDTAR